MKYLALGDSYTIGEGVPEDQTWPVLLAEEFQNKGFNFEKPKIIAKTGWTTGELLQAIQQEDLSDNYQLVSLLIGVNNQYRGQSLENYRKEFEYLVKKAITLAQNEPKRLFVVSIPDYSVTSFAKEKNPEKIRIEIEDFNKTNKEVAKDYGIVYVDITPLSRKAQHDQSLLAEDQLHPSGKMYKEWISLMSQMIANNFK
ncbi:SGNH/GDSL hydrolase family protein [soil metagenome]